MRPAQQAKMTKADMQRHTDAKKDLLQRGASAQSGNTRRGETT